jgi:hypothetical protein
VFLPNQATGRLAGVGEGWGRCCRAPRTHRAATCDTLGLAGTLDMPYRHKTNNNVHALRLHARTHAHSLHIGFCFCPAAFSQGHHTLPTRPVPCRHEMIPAHNASHGLRGLPFPGWCHILCSPAHPA